MWIIVPKMSAENSCVNLNSVDSTFTSSIDLIHMEDDQNEKSFDHDDNAEKKEAVEKIGWKRYAGLIFTLLASISSSFSFLVNKMLIQKNYHPLNVGLWRFQGMTICGTIFVAYMRIGQKQNIFKGIFENKGRVFFLLLVRATIGLVCMVTFMFSFQYIKLGDATVIYSSTPIAVFLFARIFLGELCGIVPTLASIITLVGVGVLTRPPLLTGAEEIDQNTLIGISLALTAMLILSAIFLITRYLRNVHFSVPVILYGYISSIESLIILLAFGMLELPRNGEDWCISIASATLELFFQTFLVLSLKFEAAGPVAIIRTLDIVFTFILQMLFFGVFPDSFSLIGTSIIIAGIVLATFRKWLSTLPEDHSARKKYSFILR